MAGSRLEKFGTVFTRTRDLIRAGLIKEKDKPIWYDIYAAFPPKRNPVYVKPFTRTVPNAEDKVPEIFYSEDAIRAKFYEAYGSGPKYLELFKSNYVSVCQRFVETYNQLQSTGEFDEDVLFEQTSKACLADGIILRRKSAPTVVSEPRDPVLNLKLTDLLVGEQQANPAADETAPAEEEPTLTESQSTDPKPS